MIIKESELQTNNIFNVLNSIDSLNEGEYIVNEYMIPIVENTTRGINMINLEDIVKLSESNAIDNIEAFRKIHIVHGINESESAIIVNDYTLIENSDLIGVVRKFINEGANVFIQPISSNDPNYIYCENIVNESIREKIRTVKHNIRQKAADEEAREFIRDLDQTNNPKMAKKDFWNSFNREIDDRLEGTNININDILSKSGASPDVDKYEELIKEAKGKPKSWISKKVAALRSIYAKWLARAKMEKSADRAGIIKRACAAILNVIDKLLAMIERKTA